MKIKSLIFDSSVILDLPLSEMKRSLNQIISYYVEPSKFIKAYIRAFRLLQKGKIKSEAFFDEVFKKVELPLRTQKRIIEQHNNKRAELVKLRKDFKSVLSALSSNYKLGVISNMPRDWFINDVMRLGLNTSIFNVLVFGSDEGLLKPDKRVYSRACRLLNEPVDRCVFITNDDVEVEGARKAGLTIITINSDEGDLKADTISELISILTDMDEPTKQLHEVNKP
ncbi:MAG: HAD-IA family hydrolase [Candidatus Nanoarchaeia archaeon]|jgi:HAD superfamily hydrolase (TIGR01549 family)